MAARAHVVGAGLAGLAAALALARAGRAVTVYEAAGHAGGRCRSLRDRSLGCEVDNGNHLVMAGNRATFAYLDEIGARARVVGLVPAAFPFLDLATGERWTVRPNPGPLPWWPLAPSRRIAGTRALDYLVGLRLALAGTDATVAELLGRPRTLYRRLWHPLATSALNTDPAEAAARLLWPVLRDTFLRGEAYCRPYVADRGLSHAFIDPALARLREAGGEIAFNRRVRALELGGGRVRALETTRGPAPVADGEPVVLAVPAPAAAALVPELHAPTASRAIVNAHFRLDRAPELPGGARFLGLVGGTAQWIFVRGPVASITVSAADKLAALPNERIAECLWRDLAPALGLAPTPVAPWRVINEHRATFAQTPEAARSRPGPETALANLVLAGDWTDTGLPATIEGAIRSGRRAAAAALANRGPRSA